MKKEMKLRILARNFFTDNQDQYEDYRHALTEFMANEPSDTFVEFCIEPYVTPKDGFVVMYRDDGHVAEIRNADGWFNPRTEMTHEEGAEFEEQYEKAMEEFPNLEGYDLLEKIGWVRL